MSEFPFRGRTFPFLLLGALALAAPAYAGSQTSDSSPPSRGARPDGRLEEAGRRPDTATETPIRSLSLLALDPEEGKGVVQLDDGELYIIEVGGELSGTSLRVLEVWPDRVLLSVGVVSRSGESHPWLASVELARKAGEPSRITWLRWIDQPREPAASPPPPHSIPVQGESTGSRHADWEKEPKE